ncbi:hypothetical protein [uncultured Bdellovibrio sp.]|uniref:hypothetical protein n=1 Tax=Bdellovibrio sp. HCB-162 TaxID=3394234 RepID=UPI0025FD59A6|nr:hypothetical protein [uncultured Bdellovibrio sp.]
MRLLLFVLSLAVSSVAFSSQPIVGTIERDFTGVYLHSGDLCPRYVIDSKSEDASTNIRKLTTGDTITATGLLDAQTCKAVIESVEYVGLKKMLGYWYSQDGIITVRDFNSLSFYPINLKDFQNGADYRTADPITYRYSVTPTEGKEWVVFLSDTTSTTFATIQFGKSNATMKIYDSETGDIKKILRMSKWGNLR